MAATHLQDSMGSSPYIQTHVHNTVSVPFNGDSNYGYNTPATYPASDFAGQRIQIQLYEPPMTGFINPSPPYGQYVSRDPFCAPSPTFNDYPQHSNNYHQEPVPQSGYYWDSLGHYSPSSRTEVSPRVPRRDSRSLEGLLLRPRAKHHVTNFHLALRIADREWLDIYFLRTLIELAAFLYTVFLSCRWLSILPRGSAYTQKRHKKHQRFNFSNSLLVDSFAFNKLCLGLSTKKPMDNG